MRWFDTTYRFCVYTMLFDLAESFPINSLPPSPSLRLLLLSRFSFEFVLLLLHASTMQLLIRRVFALCVLNRGG